MTANVSAVKSLQTIYLMSQGQNRHRLQTLQTMSVRTVARQASTLLRLGHLHYRETPACQVCNHTQALRASCMMQSFLCRACVFNNALASPHGNPNSQKTTSASASVCRCKLIKTLDTYGRLCASSTLGLLRSHITVCQVQNALTRICADPTRIQGFLWLSSALDDTTRQSISLVRLQTRADWQMERWHFCSA